MSSIPAFVSFAVWQNLIAAPSPCTSSQGLCVKWHEHPTGHESGDGIPLSEGRTISILLNPDVQFQIEFSPTADFRHDEFALVGLVNPGDFVAWGP
jgi:hypothetical protein